MVIEVVREPPQADRVHDGNEGEASQPQVPAPARHERAMAAIMPDDEEHRDADAIGDSCRNVYEDRKLRDGVDQRCGVEHAVGREDEKALRKRTAISARHGLRHVDRARIAGAISLHHPTLRTNAVSGRSLPGNA